MDEATMLAAAVQERAGLRYPKELRDRLTTYARRERARGASWTKIAEDLGVAGQTLQRWLEGSKPDSAGFVAVRSVRSSGTHGVALVSPTGWRVEGLGLADVAALMRELSS